jgi:hypothetical protein
LKFNNIKMEKDKKIIILGGTNFMGKTLLDELSR